jgi:excisionase family DNA binding protein
METRRTVDVQELAVELGISRNAAYEAVKRGDIPSIRVGRRVLIPADWLERKLFSLRFLSSPHSEEELDRQYEEELRQKKLRRG